MSDTSTTKVALALGSNIGDRMAYLQAAIKALSLYIKIEDISSVYETIPAYVSDQPIYLNAALIGETTVEPLALLWTVKDIESEIGREPSYRYGPRQIDIDIILYGDRQMKTTELTIPHAAMHEREFVLRPLSEIAPAWAVPSTGKTVDQLLLDVHHGDVKCLGKLLSKADI